MKQILTALFIYALSIAPVFAHGGEDHGAAPGTGDSSFTQGPIELSDEAIINLGIQTVTASLKPIEQKVSMIASVQILPEKHAFVSSLFEGRVKAIHAKLGESVEKGQKLITLEPLSIGSNPVVLKAPISGKLLRQNIVLGQPVSSETILMEIADTSELLIRGALYETPALAKIKVGQSADVIIDIFPGEIYTGTVQRLDATLEDDSRTFDVYVLIDNKDGKILPNLQAVLRVMIGEADDIRLVVPKKSVLEDAGKSFVFVRDGNEFERREVAMGIKAGYEVEILSGVFPGEDVVVQGNYQLKYIQPKKKDLEDETKPESGESEPAGHNDDGHAH